MDIKRQIKFRSWDKLGKFMMPDVDIFLRDREDFILMQFTGMTDKNGKEIYDGDIVKIEKENKFSDGTYRVDTGIGEVKFGEYIDEGDYDSIEGNGFYIESDNHPYYQNINGKIIPFFDNKIEVIGNIYENPELIS